MATDQAINVASMGDQESRSRSEEDVPAALNETSAPLNFSELTPHQFGISVESFIPSSSNCKDKSRLAQIKARRRSSVGVRGSPETNSLIRFRAQRRMKTRPASHTPELVRSSPFSPRVAFTLRQKMASFQSLMDVVESDCDPVPVQDSDTGGCILTPDYLSDEISSSEEKENNPPATPTPSKKRCLGPLEGCSVEIREGHISIPHSSLKEQEDALCKHQSPRRPPSDDPSAVSPAQKPHLFHIPSLPSLLEMKPTVDVDKTPVVRKKKQVRFGGPLSPEFFDKNLPPSTPLQKGGTPARTATPGGGSPLRSVLKTPQRSEPDAQHHRPERLSPTGFGASPTFTIPAKHRVSHERGDSEDGKTVFPSLEQIDPAVSSDAECAFDAQPLNLNMAFLEESLSQNLRADTEPNKTSQTEVMDGREFVAEEKQPEGDAESRTQSKRRRIMKKKEELENEHRARPGQRKRKQPEDSEPVKRSMRTAAKSACRKMKVASAAARCWNKGVDRSLYGSRTYASKNPALSPITERLSFTSQSLAVQQTPESSTATHHESVINLETANAAVHSEQCAEVKAVENLSHNYVRLPTCSPGQRSRQPWSTVMRGQKKSKDCEELHEELPEKHFEVQSSLSLEVSQGTPSMHTKTEQCETDPEEPSVQISADIPCTDSSKLEYDASLCASTSSCTTLGEESNSTEPPQKQVKRGRRSSALLEPLHAEEHQLSCEVTGNGAEEQADTQSSSDHQEDVGEPNVDLAPWQADFNFEDVFKHTATRGQRSVRRSLRNQANSEHRSISAGLAWMPHTSPDSVKETHRRTRQRRLSAALPVQPPLPEETQDSLMNELRAKEENL